MGNLGTFAQIDLFYFQNINFGNAGTFFLIVILFSKSAPGTLGTLGTSGTFGQIDLFSCDEQLKKWQCHSVCACVLACVCASVVKKIKPVKPLNSMADKAW